MHPIQTISFLLLFGEFRNKTKQCSIPPHPGWGGELQGCLMQHDKKKGCFSAYVTAKKKMKFKTNKQKGKASDNWEHWAKLGSKDTTFYLRMGLWSASFLAFSVNEACRDIFSFEAVSWRAESFWFMFCGYCKYLSHAAEKDKVSAEQIFGFRNSACMGPFCNWGDLEDVSTWSHVLEKLQRWISFLPFKWPFKLYKLQSTQNLDPP